MKTVNELLGQLQDTEACFVYPPEGMPLLPTGYVLPSDLTDFYRQCGGVDLYAGASYPLRIVSPKKFVRANPILRGEEGRDDLSYEWFIIGESDDQHVTIDLSASRLGRCYDSYWDRHAFPGNCPVIAESFTDLLSRLVENAGEHWYWLADDFKSLGDAYDPVRQ